MPAARTAAFARRREATCKAILDATCELISEKGIDGFTLSEVAQRGRINRALIYHYFQNREVLVAQAIDHIIGRYAQEGQQPITDSIEHSARMYIEHPEIARFIVQLLLNNRPLHQLGQRIRYGLDELDRLQREHAPAASYDAGMALVIAVLAEISWAFSRHQFAELLGVAIEEADERFIRFLQQAAQTGMPELTNGQPSRA